MGWISWIPNSADTFGTCGNLLGLWFTLKHSVKSMKQHIPITVKGRACFLVYSNEKKCVRMVDWVLLRAYFEMSLHSSEWPWIWNVSPVFVRSHNPFISSFISPVPACPLWFSVLVSQICFSSYYTSKDFCASSVLKVWFKYFLILAAYSSSFCIASELFFNKIQSLVTLPNFG